MIKDSRPIVLRLADRGHAPAVRSASIAPWEQIKTRIVHTPIIPHASSRSPTHEQAETAGTGAKLARRMEPRPKVTIDLQAGAVADSEVRRNPPRQRVSATSPCST